MGLRPMKTHYNKLICCDRDTFVSGLEQDKENGDLFRHAELKTTFWKAQSAIGRCEARQDSVPMPYATRRSHLLPQRAIWIRVCIPRGPAAMHRGG